MASLQSTSTYDGTTDQDLEQFIKTYKLHQIRDKLYSEGITIDFLLSQNDNDIKSIAKELSYKFIQQNKFIYAFNQMKQNNNNNDDNNNKEPDTIMSMNSILDILSQDVIQVILYNFTNRQRCQIANTCKSFNNAIKLIINNSIKIEWDSNININNNNKCCSNIKLTTNDEYISSKEFCSNYNNLIKIVKGDIHYNNKITKDYPFRMKIQNGQLYINSKAFNTLIYINDRINMKSHLLQFKKLNINIFTKYELGIFIQTYITTNTTDIGAFAVGFIIGNNIFSYHPGFQNPFGAARVEGTNGWNNETMGFIPNNNILQKVEIFINQKSHIFLKIIDQNKNDNNKSNEYIRDWQHDTSLFMDKASTIFGANKFGLRIANSGCLNYDRIGIFGNIYLNIGKRDINYGKISVFSI